MNIRDIAFFRALSGGPSTGGAQSDWNAAEGKPGHVLNRTHWVEKGYAEVVNGRYTTQYNADSGTFVANVGIGKIMEDVPEKIAVVFDGTRYDDISVVNIPGLGDVAGNLYFLNAVAGTSFENTGEPFIVFVTVDFLVFLTLDTTPTTHDISVLRYGDVYHKLSEDYVPTVPVLDLTKYATDYSEEVTITGDEHNEIYNALRNNDTVKLRYPHYNGDTLWYGETIAHPCIFPGVTYVAVGCLISNGGNDKRLLEIDAYHDKTYCRIHEIL